LRQRLGATSENGEEFDDGQTPSPSNLPGFPKEAMAMLVYFSRTGTTRAVGNQIVSKLEADVEALADRVRGSGWRRCRL